MENTKTHSFLETPSVISCIKNQPKLTSTDHLYNRTDSKEARVKSFSDVFRLFKTFSSASFLLLVSVVEIFDISAAQAVPITQSEDFEIFLRSAGGNQPVETISLARPTPFHRPVDISIGLNIDEHTLRVSGNNSGSDFSFGFSSAGFAFDHEDTSSKLRKITSELSTATTGSRSQTANASNINNSFNISDINGSFSNSDQVFRVSGFEAISPSLSISANTFGSNFPSVSATAQGSLTVTTTFDEIGILTEGAVSTCINSGPQCLLGFDDITVEQTLLLGSRTEGPGQLTVRKGTTLNISDSFIIGNTEEGEATIEDLGTVAARFVGVGAFSSVDSTNVGKLNIDNGSLVIQNLDDSIGSGNLSIGTNSGEGEVRVQNGGQIVSDEEIDVGSNGLGRLEIVNDATVTARSITIGGFRPESAGSLLLDGGNIMNPPLDFESDPDFTGSLGTTVLQTGKVSGSGTITSDDLLNLGIISIGSGGELDPENAREPGVLELVGGIMTNGSISRLEFDIFSDGKADMIKATSVQVPILPGEPGSEVPPGPDGEEPFDTKGGDVSLGGVIAVNIEDGFTGSPGQTIDLISARSLNLGPSFTLGETSKNADGTETFSLLNSFGNEVVKVEVPSLGNDLSLVPDIRFENDETIFGIRVGEPDVKNIIVLTHGWQPDQNEPINTSNSRLPEVRSAIDKRLKDEGLDKSTKIIELVWEEAFTADFDAQSLKSEFKIAREKARLSDVTLLQAVLESDTVRRYFDAFNATDSAGLELATLVKQALADFGNNFQSDDDINVHFIGHSLGTMVNAYAAQALQNLNETAPGFSIDQFTILEDPLLVDSQFFYNTLSDNIVDNVDNYFAELLFPGNDFPRFGDPILGTSPCGQTCSGLSVTGEGHNGVHRDFYAPLVATGNWNSPVLENFTETIRWDPFLARNAAATNDSEIQILFSDVSKFRTSEVEVTNGIVDVTGEGSTESFRLQSQSPATFQFSVDLPSDIQFLQFDFIFEVADGAVLELLFDGLVLWSAKSSDFNPFVFETVTLPLHCTRL